MKGQRSRVTVQGIAAIRAVESSKPPGQRICYDPLAPQLVSPVTYLLVKLSAGYGDIAAPGTTGFLVARARFMDDTLVDCLHSGIEQLVIWGSFMAAFTIFSTTRSHRSWQPQK